MPQGRFRTEGFRALLFVPLALLAMFGASSPVPAADLDKELFIISSFPESVYQRVVDAFVRHHPGLHVYVLNKKTPAAIDYVQEKIGQRPDIFWASSPDAFEVLKESGDLRVFRPDTGGPPQSLGSYPVNDPDGTYTGFAVSGYGMMWNIRYLERNGLPVPTGQTDLLGQAYHRHIGITAPSRSGTTHVIVEGILQDLGWERGWAFLMELAGNLATVTARSFSVIEGINSGRFGIGLVIDFLGLSSKATGLPVDFRYFAKTPVLPASVAILKDAKNPRAAEAFVRFLVSDPGQRLLFEPELTRLPVVPAAYANAPPGYPNPFAATSFDAAVQFDSQHSRMRYHLVNSLFDTLITFRVRRLNSVWAAIHRAEEALRLRDDPEMRSAVERARKLATLVPVSDGQSQDPAFTSIFVRKQPGRAPPEQQVRVEKEWDSFVSRNLAEALHIVEAQADFLEERIPAGGRP